MRIVQHEPGILAIVAGDDAFTDSYLRLHSRGMLSVGKIEAFIPAPYKRLLRRKPIFEVKVGAPTPRGFRLTARGSYYFQEVRRGHPREDEMNRRRGRGDGVRLTKTVTQGQCT